MKRILSLFLLPCFTTVVCYGAPRVLPVGELPNDVRLKQLKDLNGYFPFHVPATLESWEKRAASLRRRILVSNGLFPMPEKTPLNAVTHGLVKRPGFTVEKVYFESLPGLLVTGLLFRPVGTDGKLPAVLSPHGHGGRLQDAGPDRIQQMIRDGAEKYAESGRMPKVARCATLARLGCVTFLYDMMGYADNRQISYELAHRFAKQRPEMEDREGWGLFSTQAELRLHSVMGLQTWNSIRALDFLESLPDVDSRRMAVTGGSGGGTQTILLCAIDPRPIAAFPQGMVSTAMQGGCTCENCCLLRVGTGNVELAALFAPKPQCMTAANDWTREMMVKGYPELRQLYAMYGKQENVFCKSQVHFPHNFNYMTRALMYSWFNKHMKLGIKGEIVEKDFELLTKEEHAVWNNDHLEPEGGDAFEIKLTRWMADQDRNLIQAIEPGKRKKMLRQAWATMIGRERAEAKDVEWKPIETTGDNYRISTGILRLDKHGEALPVLVLRANQPHERQLVIWVDGGGKGSLFDDDEEPLGAVRELLEAGISVATADLFMQGEFLADHKPPAATRKVDNPREYAGYSFGYNHTLFARRTHDILTLITKAKNSGEKQPREVHLVATNGAGPWALAAMAQSGNTISKAIIDTGGFRFADLTTHRAPNFLPGAVKYGDIPGLISLAGPRRALHISGESPAILQSMILPIAESNARVVLEKGKLSPEGVARFLLE